MARYEISTNSWLTTWTEDNVLDNGNQFVTGLVADYGRLAGSGLGPANPEQLWIGGEDGFQLIDVVNGVEIYDIEKSSNLFAGSGNPHDMIVNGTSCITTTVQVAIMYSVSILPTLRV